MNKQKERKKNQHEFNTYTVARTKGLGARQNETLRHKTKGDARVMGNRWKQSGNRGDIRLGTHEEGQVT